MTGLGEPVHYSGGHEEFTVSGPLCSGLPRGDYFISFDLCFVPNSAGFGRQPRLLLFSTQELDPARIIVGGPELGPIQISPADAMVEVGQTLEMTAALTSSFPPFLFSWTGLPQGCGATSTGQDFCMPTHPGEFNVSVSVIDGLGNNATSPAALVQVAPALTLTFDVPAEAMQGAVVNINATAVGGFPPYSYYWTGLPPGCPYSNSSTIACSPSSVGNFTIDLEVVDSKGNNRTTNGVISVVPHTQPSSVGGLPTVPVALIVAAAVLVSISALYLRRRLQRKDRVRPPSGPP